MKKKLFELIFCDFSISTSINNSKLLNLEISPHTMSHRHDISSKIKTRAHQNQLHE
jgi:hypothetical protein